MGLKGVKIIYACFRDEKCLEVKLQLNQFSGIIFAAIHFIKDHTNSEWEHLQRNCTTVFETIYRTLDMPNFI